jgi:polyisoprenoid-binding protein YceI
VPVGPRRSFNVATVDFGNEELSETAAWSDTPAIFQASTFPIAHYVSTLTDFVDGAPTVVDGTLTLHGVTRPLALTIASFPCIASHPVLKKEVCGAEAIATLIRSDYGITVGQRYGFKMEVTLRIQVEAIRDG